MKYWNALTELENELIKLDTVISVMRVAGNSMETEIDESDLRNVIWLVQDFLEEIQAQSSDKFQQLWNEIRTDSFDEEVYYPENSKQSVDELTSIVNSWVNQ
jgi:chemotaxis regulatin CheY-phosphate phosphatase CheZ